MNRKHIVILICCAASAAILFLSAMLVSAAGENTRHAAIIAFAIAGVSAMLFGVSHLNVRYNRFRPYFKGGFVAGRLAGTFAGILAVLFALSRLW